MKKNILEGKLIEEYWSEAICNLMSCHVPEELLHSVSLHTFCSLLGQLCTIKTNQSNTTCVTSFHLSDGEHHKKKLRGAFQKINKIVNSFQKFTFIFYFFYFFWFGGGSFVSHPFYVLFGAISRLA